MKVGGRVGEGDCNSLSDILGPGQNTAGWGGKEASVFWETGLC